MTDNDDVDLTIYMVTGNLGDKQPMGKIKLPDEWNAESLKTMPVMEMFKYTTTEIARVCEEYAAQLRKAVETM